MREGEKSVSARRVTKETRRHWEKVSSDEVGRKKRGQDAGKVSSEQFTKKYCENPTWKRKQGSKEQRRVKGNIETEGENKVRKNTRVKLSTRLNFFQHLIFYFYTERCFWRLMFEERTVNREFTRGWVQCENKRRWTSKVYRSRNATRHYSNVGNRGKVLIFATSSITLILCRSRVRIQLAPINFLYRRRSFVPGRFTTPVRRGRSL